MQVGGGARNLSIALGRLGGDAVGERGAQLDLGLEAFDDEAQAAEAAPQRTGRVQKAEVQAPGCPQLDDGVLEVDMHPRRNSEDGKAHGRDGAAL
jgi:hypothetical protein